MVDQMFSPTSQELKDVVNAISAVRPQLGVECLRGAVLKARPNWTVSTKVGKLFIVLID